MREGGGKARETELVYLRKIIKPNPLMAPFPRLAHDEQWGQVTACGGHELVGASPQWHGHAGRYSMDKMRLRE